MVRLIVVVVIIFRIITSSELFFASRHAAAIAAVAAAALPPPPSSSTNPNGVGLSNSASALNAPPPVPPTHQHDFHPAYRIPGYMEHLYSLQHASAASSSSLHGKRYTNCINCISLLTCTCMHSSVSCSQQKQKRVLPLHHFEWKCAPRLWYGRRILSNIVDTFMNEMQ